MFGRIFEKSALKNSKLQKMPSINFALIYSQFPLENVPTKSVEPRQIVNNVKKVYAMSKPMELKLPCDCTHIFKGGYKVAIFPQKIRRVRVASRQKGVGGHLIHIHTLRGPITACCTQLHKS